MSAQGWAEERRPTLGKCAPTVGYGTHPRWGRNAFLSRRDCVCQPRVGRRNDDLPWESARQPWAMGHIPVGEEMHFYPVGIAYVSPGLGGGTTTYPGNLRANPGLWDTSPLGKKCISIP